MLMKRVYMEKYYHNILKNKLKNPIVTLLLLIFVSITESSVASTLNQCDAQAKLPKHLSHITFKGNGDIGCNNPIIIENAKNTAEGIAAEKIWIKTCYPSSRIIVKVLSHRENKIYEIIEVTQTDNTSKQVCFDITKFFGSW